MNYHVQIIDCFLLLKNPETFLDELKNIAAEKNIEMFSLGDYDLADIIGLPVYLDEDQLYLNDCEVSYSEDNLFYSEAFWALLDPESYIRFEGEGDDYWSLDYTDSNVREQNLKLIPVESLNLYMDPNRIPLGVFTSREEARMQLGDVVYANSSVHPIKLDKPLKMGAVK